MWTALRQWRRRKKWSLARTAAELGLRSKHAWRTVLRWENLEQAPRDRNFDALKEISGDLLNEASYYAARNRARAKAAA